jgi:hypothetical protein
MDKSKSNPLFLSKHAPKPGQTYKGDPYGVAKSFLASTMSFAKPAQTPATPKSKTVPYLATSLAEFHSSSPAAPLEPITPEKVLARRELFKESVHQVAAEAFREDNGMFDAPHPLHCTGTLRATVTIITLTLLIRL